ncbi:MAG TPA: hypothetical protein VLQ52_07620, partial [Coriobacteriia bacterium]|nr:hypothetical protein [Coriobacteriia bacterium]
MATDPQHEQVPFGRAENRTPRGKVLALIFTLVLLALALFAIYAYNASRDPAVPGPTDLAQSAGPPPEYLYSIGEEAGRDALVQPLGVDVSADDLVYVTDAGAGAVRVYTVEGEYRFSFSEISDGDRTALGTPVYVEVNSIGEVFVSDRRHRAVYVFSPDGVYLRKVAPADAGEAKVWGPLALAFDVDDDLW